MNDREFVSTTGTRHRLAQYPPLPGIPSTSCGRVADLTNPVVQQRVKDCKRCYPKGAGNA